MYVREQCVRGEAGGGLRKGQFPARVMLGSLIESVDTLNARQILLLHS